MRWHDLSRTEPRFAARARERLVDPGVLLVVTIRRAGTPSYGPDRPVIVDESSAGRALSYLLILAIEELLDFVQLNGRRESKVEPLSGGMKRRLTIARALVNDPELLLLDEPTTGLDDAARREVERMILDAGAGGRTLVIATHHPIAPELGARVVSMRDGSIEAAA